MSEKAIWTSEPTHPISKANEEPLQKLCCPACNAEFPIRTLRIKQGSHYSNLKCKICDDIRSSKLWRCECEMPWIKCRTHVLPHRPAKRALERRCRKLPTSEFGHVQPLPKRVVLDIGNVPIAMPSDPGRPIRLKPGSKLAMRFPHFVEGTNPTKGSGTNEGN